MAATESLNAVETTESRIRQKAAEGLAKAEADEAKRRDRIAAIRRCVFDRIVEIAAERGIKTSSHSIALRIAEGLKQTGIDASASEVQTAMEICGVDVSDDLNRY